MIIEKRRGKYAIHEELSIEQIDSVLEDKYGYGLIHFVESLKAILFYTSMRSVPPPSYSNLPALIKALQNVKENIIKSFDSYYNLVPFLKHEGENSIINRYKLKETLKIIDAEINHYRKLQSYDSKGGPKVKPITILSYIWSHFLRDKRGVHWDQIEGLLHWFWKYLNNEIYRKVFGDQIPDWDRIKRGVLRLKKRAGGKALKNTYVEFFKKYSINKNEQNRIFKHMFSSFYFKQN